MRSITSVSIFDQNIVRTSPAGSCVLRIAEELAGDIPLHLFSNRAEIAESKLVRKTKIPLPPGPVVVRSVLFSLFSCFAYWLIGRRAAFSISTEGTFPFCDLCYAHFCHRVFLREHRDSIGGGTLRRTARILNHAWAAFTERIAFRSAGTIVAPSQGLARELMRAYPKLVGGKIRVIPNPVNIEAQLTTGGTGIQPVRLSFCALGNFERKGLRLILEALARIPDVDVHLTVIGGTPGEIRDYERLAAGDRVRFVGFQPDVRPYLLASDAFVFPSAYEVFPLVCLQAAAAGLPLLVTRLYGVEEFMRDGETGWVVERSAESIAAAIVQAASDRPRLRAMGLEARKQVEQYSETEFRRRWRELLESLVVT
ncbi:MAG TPA: glycosyltransferase family 4 protein [Bryobacteraceae bacterium]|nr:glycosyltransferase family 4 protein [Bryobacteraceae bacterium]